MYSQKAQVAIMQVGGAPTVLPKEPTERLKLVTAAVDAITESPPKRTHTRTTKGGASTSGSARDPIPDPGFAPKSLAPRVAVPTMAPTRDSARGQGSAGLMTGSGEPKSGWGALSALPADLAGGGPGAPVAAAQLNYHPAAAQQLIDRTQQVLDGTQAAPAAAARSSGCVLSVLSGDRAENGSSQEVQGEIRTPSP